MAKTFTTEELKQYFREEKTHKLYKETVDLYDQLRMHANKEYPDKLIGERRPAESTDTHAYRKKIYKSKTSNPIKKVLSSLSKIRRSQDWSIKYDEDKSPANIVTGERLIDYCETNYPGHTSITNWVFTVMLKNQMIDANAVVAVLPLSFMVDGNEYLKPVATIFNSNQIIYYEDGADFAILKSTDKADIPNTDGSQRIAEAKIFYVITTTEVFKYVETDNSGTFAQDNDFYYKHDKGKLPVFKLRGVYQQSKDNATLQVSRIEPMLEDLDEAAREYSDLQAVKVQHAHPLFWYVDNKECSLCKGHGQTIDRTGEVPCTVSCTQCNGTGKVKFSPYTHIRVDPPKVSEGQVNIPNPPAGYIQRDVAVMEFLQRSVDKHLYDALSALNMQFLDQTPLNISGEAKQVDREELNNFVYSIAEDLVQTMDRIYYWVNEWRNNITVPDAKARLEMLPKIAVPENFDLLPSEYLVDEIKKVKDSKLNPVIISSMELEFATKTFYNNPEVSDFLSAVHTLDPLPALSEDDKMMRLSNGGITQIDYILSSNLVSFLKRAIFEDKDFYKKLYNDQLKLMVKFAEEKSKVISKAAELKIEAEPDNDPNNPIPE